MGLGPGVGIWAKSPITLKILVPTHDSSRFMDIDLVDSANFCRGKGLVMSPGKPNGAEGPGYVWSLNNQCLPVSKYIGRGVAFLTSCCYSLFFFLDRTDSLVAGVTRFSG